VQGLGEEGEGNPQLPQSVPQDGFCVRCSRCSEDAAEKGFDATLTAWSGPGDAVLHQHYLARPVPLKVVSGRLRGKGFARFANRKMAHIFLYLGKVSQGNLLQWVHTLIEGPLHPSK